jgi:hypothetical protein
VRRGRRQDEGGGFLALNTRVYFVVSGGNGNCEVRIVPLSLGSSHGAVIVQS